MQYSFWPVPAYTDQVGDDEMVLFKAQEEAEALAAAQAETMRREQEAQQQQEGDEGSPQFGDAFSDDDDDEEHEDAEHLASSSMWPQTPPEASTMHAFASPSAAQAIPSPRYEVLDPLAAAGSSLLTPSRPTRNPNRRTRTTSNLALTPPSSSLPAFSNGAPMSRHLSNPLSPSPTSSSPPSASSSFGFTRRSRAHSHAAPNVGGRTISEPLSWTLVRSQYSYPKRGLTAQQMSFLSSVESLGRFGMPTPRGGGAAAGMGVLPSPAYEPRREVEGGDYGFPTVPQ